MLLTENWMYTDYMNINSLSEIEQISIIGKMRHQMQFIKNPSENVQVAFVKLYPNCIGEIDAQCEVAQLYVVEKFSFSRMDRIKNPTENVQLLMVEKVNYLPKNVTSEKAIQKFHMIQNMKNALE